ANDLFIAVRAASEEAATTAREAAETAVFAAHDDEEVLGAERPARTLAQVLRDDPGTNLAVVSVPGDYAPLEAHKALTAGLDVLLFSDNVPVEAEIELKERAGRLGRLLMG